MGKRTCWHLDQYLEDRVIMRGEPRPELEVVYHPDVDDRPEAEKQGGDPTKGSWDLFKKLRKLPLDRDQVLLLIRHRGLKQSRQTVLKEMGWTSNQTFDRRLAKAEAILKKRGLE